MRCTLRAATAGDAAAVADLYLASRRIDLPYAPAAYSEAEIRQWMAEILLPGGGVQLALDRERVVGFSAISEADDGGWIEQMFVRPGLNGRGIGTRLLGHALAELPRPVWLYTFQANQGARRFYERHGFLVHRLGDGAGNEERVPDVLYRYPSEIPP